MPFKDREKAKASRLKHYYSNPQQYKERSKKRKRKIREFLQSLKSKTPCMDCKIQWPHYVMHFDHRPGVDKKFVLAAAVNKGFSDEIIQEEINKCDIVCANCHAIRTYQRLYPVSVTVA